MLEQVCGLTVVIITKYSSNVERNIDKLLLHRSTRLQLVSNCHSELTRGHRWHKLPVPGLDWDKWFINWPAGEQEASVLRAETIVVQLNIGRSQRVKSYFYQVQGRLKPSIKHFKNILNTYITSYTYFLYFSFCLQRSLNFYIPHKSMLDIGQYFCFWN